MIAIYSSYSYLKFFFFSVSAEGVQPMAWVTRVNIAIGVARGLTLLHSLDQNVIFRDLKASNILLDSVCDIKSLVSHFVTTGLCEFPFWKSSLMDMQDFNAKLSDFGLARDGPTGDNTHVSTRVIGTQGYAAPEYVATGIVPLSWSKCWDLNLAPTSCFLVKIVSNISFYCFYLFCFF